MSNLPPVRITRSAVLKFQTETDRPCTISIRRADFDKTGDAMKASMDKMLDLGILRLTRGTPTEPLQATHRKTTTTWLYRAPAASQA